MLLTIRSAGIIQSVLDYYLVTDTGKLVFDGSGTWLWVEQLEVSNGANGRWVIRECIRRLAEAIPQAQGAYWVRKGKTGTTIKQYTRERLVRLAMREGVRV